jgi:hypothetical protein
MAPKGALGAFGIFGCKVSIFGGLGGLGNTLLRLRISMINARAALGTKSDRAGMDISFMVLTNCTPKRDLTIKNGQNTATPILLE